MSATLLDGTRLAHRLTSDLKPRAEAFARKTKRAPCLSVVSIGANLAAKSYSKNQQKSCKEADIESRVKEFPQDASEKDVVNFLENLSRDSAVDGILIETPVPVQIRLASLLNALSPQKDVEGLTPQNYGRLFSAKSSKDIETYRVFIPPTAQAVVELLKEYGLSTLGKDAVVIGRSTIVGRPVSHLLSCMDATVTLCHSRTENIAQHLKRADIVVAAVGQPKSIRGTDLKAGAVVIDAGIAFDGKKLCGDVDFKSTAAVAGFITPVPGGVGPVTTAMLLSNVVLAAERRMSK